MDIPKFCTYVSLPIECTEHYLTWLQTQGVALPTTLHRAVLKRQCEFLAGRLCAKRAMAGCGVKAEATLKIGEHREPLWPAGVMGSISHCDTHAVAIATCLQPPASSAPLSRTQFSASGEVVQGIGIDIERKMSEETAQQIVRHLLLPQEMVFRDHLEPQNSATGELGHDSENIATFVTLIFSAKESLYKAIFPQVRRILEFDCAAVTEIQPQAGSLILTLQADLAPNLCSGMKFTVYFEWLAKDRIQTFVVI